ncbi:DoxX family protein [Methylacidiphilales bacterium]|nr:DoxX family protein [Candidatus Methylacidiphilales bacterium]
MCYLFILSARLIVRLFLALLFLFAGTVHLLDPSLFLPVMPPWIPFPLLCIKASGIFELLGGIGLLIPEPRILFLIGWGLTLLLVAVFPANIYMAVAHVKVHGFPSESWIGWARLPLQPLLILAVLWVTRIWPGKQRR